MMRFTNIRSMSFGVSSKRANLVTASSKDGSILLTYISRLAFSFLSTPIWNSRNTFNISLGVNSSLRAR